ncbi:hypothetical protein C2G38_2075484 [Gigaspora rosea]|uniref:Uncharacterized protein n=1 Tax=Gigaspora rosea TaxID=44941 RepID=A0A397VKY0_9GLOM|nr:hypothetical protein C2G38_2075484 [Gigaspora rosea]
MRRYLLIFKHNYHNFIMKSFNFLRKNYRYSKFGIPGDGNRCDQNYNNICIRITYVRISN